MSRASRHRLAVTRRLADENVRLRDVVTAQRAVALGRAVAVEEAITLLRRRVRVDATTAAKVDAQLSLLDVAS